MKGIVFKGRGKQPWRWRIQSRNGKIIADGEGHPTAWTARMALQRTVRSIVLGNSKPPYAVYVVFNALPTRPAMPMTLVWAAIPMEGDAP
jgi:uncharacterized protein YegP (UPF0339 family)